MAIRALIWNENEHEKRNALVKKLYPEGIHGAIAKAFDADNDITVETATLDMPEHGLTEALGAEGYALLGVIFFGLMGLALYRVARKPQIKV